MSESNQKPYVFFDIETTGVDVAKDRIVQLAYIRFLNNEKKEFCELINPGVNIPKEATEVHKITDEMVKDKPAFSFYAKQISAVLSDSILVGFNIVRFDLPLIIEELGRCKIYNLFTTSVIIDLMKIYHLKNPRNLLSCYKEYTGEDLVNGHDALVDTRACQKIFRKMLDTHDDLGDSMEQISEMCFEGKRPIDLTNRIIQDEAGEYIFNFGKNKGRKVRLEVDYCDWMLKNDFPQQVKFLINQIQRGKV